VRFDGATESQSATVAVGSVRLNGTRQAEPTVGSRDVIVQIVAEFEEN